jgi:hypothetical protein
MAVRDDSRARVLYRLPEQRRVGAGGMPSLLSMVLLAVVLFLGGLLVGRATTRGTVADTPPATTAATAPSDQAQAAPPAAATTPQAQAGEAAAAGGVGPRQVVHEVPVGYQHSQAGAVAAAANYAKVLSSELILDKASRRKAIDTLSAPEARARQQRAFDRAVASLAKGLGVKDGGAADGTVLLRAVPVGWRLEAYTSVAGSLGGSPGGVPVQEGWGTTTVELRWVGGDWKQLESTTKEGPAPVADAATPTAASQLIPEAQEFKEFTYAPGS